MTNHNVLHEKLNLKKNVLLTNTSVKKMKQIKKISINDNETKILLMKSKKKLDSSNKDNEFCSSIGQYTGFLADNFTMMYIMKDKITYLIDMNQMSPNIISTFENKSVFFAIITQFNS